MDADRFRSRLASALGEPPDLGPAVQRLRAHLATLDTTPPPANRSAAAMAVVAGVLAVAVITTLLGTRLLAGHRTQPRPFTAASSAGCRLPVAVTNSAYPPTAQAAGFVAVGSGTFRRDASAPTGALTYDPVARRWLPVRAIAIAPDHSAYAYPVSSGEFLQIHVHEIATGVDRLVSTLPGGTDFPIEWTASGIEVTTIPAGGGITRGWLVPPDGGQPGPGPLFSMTAEYDRTNVGTLLPTVTYETSFHGMSIVRSAQDGTYLLAPGGQRTVIHAASADFDPSTFVADGDRLWAVNADGSAIWLWTQKGGLQRFALHGQPQASTTYWAAGPCA
jgi:hypothetical protein